MVGVVTAVNSAIVGAVVSVSVVYSSSSLPHEIMIRLKRSMEKIMSKCFIGFLTCYFRRNLHIAQFGDNLQEFGMFSDSYQ